MRTKQQKTGDRLEQQALKDARQLFASAELTKASGQCYQDGDLRGLPELHVECKNSDRLGKGRSISKADWNKIKSQAAKRILTPVHLGLDDDGEVLALLPWKDLLVLLYTSGTRENR